MTWPSGRRHAQRVELVVGGGGGHIYLSIMFRLLV
jgi:hypothetical protein